MTGLCKNCGAQLRDGAVFCVACGTKVEEQTEAAAPALPIQPDQSTEPLLQAPPVQPEQNNEALPIQPEQARELPPPVSAYQAPPGTEYKAPSGTESQTPPPAYQASPGYQTPPSPGPDYQAHPPGPDQTQPPGTESQTPPPGYGQPGQPVHSQPQAPTYSAPPKKKGLPKLLLIAIIIAAAIVALILILPNVVSGQGDKDFFTLGVDQVPSVKFILGEKREIIGISSSTSNGVQEMVIGYKVDKNQNKEMEKYAKTLIKDYGYINTNIINFTGPQGSDFQFAKASEEEGYIVTVKIDYDSKGYTLTLTRGKGDLTISEEPEPVEPEPEPAEPVEPDEPALPAAEMVDIIIDERLAVHSSEAEAIADLKKKGIEAFNNNDGSFTFRMTKEKQQELKDENKKSMTKFLEKLKDEGLLPGLLDVEYTQDFSSIKIIYNDTLELDSDEMLVVLLYCGLFGPLYQVYDGKGLDAKTVIAFYDIDKGTIKGEFISPDMYS